MVVLTLFTEILIVFKFDMATIIKPFPNHVIIFWTVMFSSLVLWTIWHFYIKPYLNWKEKQCAKGMLVNDLKLKIHVIYNVDLF